MSERSRGRRPTAPGEEDGGGGTLDRRGKVLAPFGEVWEGRHATDAVFGRDAEIARVVAQIDRVGRSFLLVGPSGVGKTTILRHVLRELSSRRENAWRFVETTTGLLVAGQVYFGQWQGNVKSLLAAARRSTRAGILLGDPANLFSTGRSQRSEDSIGSFMAPAIERGKVLLFGEATPEVHAALLAANPSIARLFDTIHIEPQTPEAAAETVRLVSAARMRIAGNRRGLSLHVSPEAVDRCVTLGEAYFPASSRPAGAIRLLDGVLEESVLGPLLPAEGSSGEESPRVTIPPAAVITALCHLTGAPRGLLDDSLPLPATEVRRFFQGRLVGQGKAIDAVVDLVAMIKAGLVDPARPAGVLLFVGPTGVGKTELARLLAEFTFGSAERLVRLDMSEYARPDAAAMLAGSLDDGKGLLARVRRQPFSVILLDEIEKAHPVVFDLLLQLFDAGRLSTPGGETVNFTQSVVILTSNLGAGEPPPGGFGFRGTEAPSAEDWIRHSVGEFFRPEFVNRIGRIVVFDPLARDDVRVLAQREVGAVLLRSGITRRRLNVDVDRGVVDLLVDAGYDPLFGARPLKRAVERILLGPLAHLLSETPAEGGGLIRMVPAGDKVRVVTIRDDREARRQELAAVQVADPFDGAATRATVETLRRWLGELASEVQKTRDEHERHGLATKRTALVAATAAPNFWDDPARARAALADLYRIERVGEGLRECVDRADGLAEDVRRAGRSAAAAEIARLAAEIDGCRRQATLLRYAILCDSPLQRLDAFVVLDALDPAAREHVRQLADCHAAWARRLGFEVVAVHEEGVARDGAKQVVLQINGAAVYGMLSAEHGFHEFLPDAKSARRLVRVTVMPVPGDPPGEDEVVVKVTPRGGKRQEVRATHRASGRSVTIRPPEGAPGETLARELLAAETGRQAALAAGAGGQETVRRWWFGARPAVRDPRTGVSVSRIKDVLAGGIDRFLVAFLEGRDGAGPGDSAQGSAGGG